MKLPRWRYIIFFTVFSLVFTHFTRFENDLSLQLYDGKVLASLNGQTLERQIFQDPISKISAQFSESMVARNYLTTIEVLQGDQTKLEYSPFSLYFLGRDLIGNLNQPKWPRFQKSFGDWTMDRGKSFPLSLYEETIDQPLVVNAKFLGRGSYSLDLVSTKSQKISLVVNDGFIDNVFSICVDTECTNSLSEEKIFTNLGRILNFFSEGFLLALLFCSIIKLFARFPSQADIADNGIAFDAQTIKPKLFYGLALSFLILSHLLVCAFVSKQIFASTPHISDSSSYYRQAVVLSSGKLLTAEIPVKPFEAFLSNNSALRENKIEYRHSNHFWPALLAIAVKLEMADLLSPVLSCLSAIAIFWLVNVFFNSQIALIACLLYTFSPFVLVLSGDYMPHIPTQTMLLGSIVCSILSWQKKSFLFGFIAGFLWGYAFSIRQATACAYLIPALLYGFVKAPLAIKSRTSLAAICGFIPIMILMVLNNFWVTGKWFALPHSYLYGRSIKFSNLAFGADQGDAILAYLPPILFSANFPQLVLGLIFFPFLLTFRKEPYFLISIFLLLFGVHLFFDDTGLHGFGPRFIFEAIWVLYALIAASVVTAYNYCTKTGRYLLVISFTALFLGNLHGLWTVLPYYRNYNNLSSDHVEQIRIFDPAKVIFVMDYGSWQSMELGVSIFDPDFKRTIMISPTKDQRYLNIIDAYPERKIILVGYNQVKEVSKEQLINTIKFENT